MSTPDFRALNEAWVGEDKSDFPRWSGRRVVRLREDLDSTQTMRERLLFSAWLNTLRAEWDAWCRGYEARRGR